MKIVGFGDFLMHFSPIMDERFMQSALMQLTYTGAEANVLAALAYWGEDTRFVTRLPAHTLARKGIAFLDSLRIDTRAIAEGKGRMGTYYLEKGHGLRPSSVIYDRVPSAFSESCPEDYDFEAALDGADALVLSGITPALSDGLFDCTQKLMQLARARGLAVFYDVNYRSALQTADELRAVFDKLAPYITHLVCNEEHLKTILSYESPHGEEEEARAERTANLARRAKEKYGIKNIAVTVRRTKNARATGFGASYLSGDDFAVSRFYEIDALDRVGSGDAFTAGLIYAACHGNTPQEAVDFAAASCALKHSVQNDINFVTVAEVLAVAEGARSDVRR